MGSDPSNLPGMTSWLRHWSSLPRKQLRLPHNSPGNPLRNPLRFNRYIGYPCCCGHPNPISELECNLCDPTPVYAWVEFQGVAAGIGGNWPYCIPDNCEDWNDTPWTLKQCSGNLCHYGAVTPGAPHPGCPEEYPQNFPAGCEGDAPVPPEEFIVDLNGWRIDLNWTMGEADKITASVIIWPLYGPVGAPWGTHPNYATLFRGDIGPELVAPDFTTDCRAFTPVAIPLFLAPPWDGPCDWTGASCILWTAAW